MSPNKGKSMQKTKSRVVEQILSVLLSVGVISTFSTYVQASNADEQKVKTVVEVQQAEKEKKTYEQLIEAEIVAHKEKIKALQLQRFADQRTTFTDEELAQLLYAVGFEGKALKVAWAVVKKESNGRPIAFNGNTRTGDSSYGIFQINMIGGLGVDRREKFDLKSNAELFNPVVNAEIAYHMSSGGEKWEAWKVGSGYNGVDQERYESWLKKFPEGVTP
jgi:hypothetical protein